MDVSGVISGNIDHSACVMPPPTKRSKLYAFFAPVMLQFFEYWLSVFFQVLEKIYIWILNIHSALECSFVSLSNLYSLCIVVGLMPSIKILHSYVQDTFFNKEVKDRDLIKVFLS